MDAEPSNPVPLHSRRSAAVRLGVSVRTLDGLIASGHLPVVRIGRSVRLDPAELDALIARSTERRSRPAS